MFCHPVLCLDYFTAAANQKSPLAGFNEFMYKNIVPACFLAPMKPTFDITDAQTVLVGIISGMTNTDGYVSE